VIKFILTIIFIFTLDQIIKIIFVDGFRWNGEWLSLILVYNKGVAFSMFAFLEEYLKFIQIVLLGVVGYFFYKENYIKNYPIISGILFGAGFSNVFDRFIREGVVDYIYYHGWFEFAVFNFADVMIDFSVGMLLLHHIIKVKNEKNSN
jgi:signal peptidase II